CAREGPVMVELDYW
nr:immunoglobulin heavy chain junction region [Macaca mulatta]MOW78043.1 immunoglobulin heavy chain junction region [Macaca mulatta]MOW78465.1 immunoglobulin heavy chain junction region [Macaca mulatta]MOW78592.1 immunoglobulin heavy chain junction region [Macaca mulatta]MOW80295.1 immunoglobulin heavy chain junction region [Macaca mulatta]